MAFSASFDYVRTADQLIEASLRKLGVLAEGQSSSTNQKTYGTEALNVLLKSWQGYGMPIWNMRFGYIYPIHDTNTISIGSTAGLGHASDELILTKLTADAATSATTITVSITAAVDVVGTTTNADFIGIELDDGTMHWTTISSGGGTTGLTIGTGLASAAATGNRVYAYTNKMNRLEAIENAWLVTASTGARIELPMDARTTVQGNSVLSTEGEPIHYNYQESYHTSPANGGFGTFTFWPRFQNGEQYIEIYQQHPFDDIDTSSTDNIALPPVWYRAVILHLAIDLGLEYSAPAEKMAMIKGLAKEAFDIAQGASTEGTSIFFAPTERL